MPSLGELLGANPFTTTHVLVGARVANTLSRTSIHSNIREVEQTARPTKPVDVMSKNLTKEEKKSRQENEAKLKGSSDNIVPSEYLNEEQKAYFEEVVEHYKASGILSNLDVAIIEQYAKARHAIDFIDQKMIEYPSFMLDKNLMIQREKWEKSFNRASNELGLSPQSRAKLGNIKATKANQETDPLLKALKRVK